MASDDASLEVVVAFLFLMALKRAVRSARLSLKKKKSKKEIITTYSTLSTISGGKNKSGCHTLAALLTPSRWRP